jgi:hypothetical protein
LRKEGIGKDDSLQTGGKEMNGNVTQRDIAKKAGVSHVTVSLALQGHPWSVDPVTTVVSDTAEWRADRERIFFASAGAPSMAPGTPPGAMIAR